jgi:dihydrofolate reductase
MGYIKSSLFISLDGVIESPETWHFEYFNDEMGAAVGALMGGNDATQLGRQTYDEFAGYWPNACPNDPITGQMTGSRKYVVSNTLTDAGWENSTVVSGDVKTELIKLKQDNNLGTTGSATLVRWLLEEGLVDELRLPGAPGCRRARQEAVRGRRDNATQAGLRYPLQYRRAAPDLLPGRRLTDRSWFAVLPTELVRDLPRARRSRSELYLTGPTAPAEPDPRLAAQAVASEGARRVRCTSSLRIITRNST